jgi:hypothetical protein
MGSEQIALSFSTLPSSETLAMPADESRERDAAAEPFNKIGIKRAGHICVCDRAALMRFCPWQ